MQCKYCGAEIGPKTKLCPQCGRFLGDEEAELQRKRRRNLWIGLGIVGVALAFVLTTFGGNYLSQQMTNENLQRQISAASPSNLGVTFQQFKDAFDANPYAKKNALAIGGAALTKGERMSTAQIRFSDRLALNALVGRIDNKVAELQLVGVPSREQADLVKFVTAMGVLIDTFSPDVPVKERGKILQELGFDKETDIYKADKQTVRGNVKYRFKFVDKVGFVFGVENVQYRP